MCRAARTVAVPATVNSRENMKTASLIGVLCVFFLLSVAAISFGAVMTGGDMVYRVEEGDSLLLVGAKCGVDPAAIMKENAVSFDDHLRPGQELKFPTRKIAPKTADNGVIIDIPGRMLYYFKAGKLEMFFPVGLGLPRWEGMTRWRTPSGTFTVTGKEQNPVWYVPQSIQRQMEVQGKPVLTELPPGPNNPLGRFVLYTSLRGIAIHETIWPTTVFQFRSHGCIRVLARNMEQLYQAVEIGTQGELVYDPVKVAVTDDGKVFLEVDRDVYGKVRKLFAAVIDRMNDLQLSAEVDWTKIRTIARRQRGIAEEVTLFPVRRRLQIQR